MSCTTRARNAVTQIFVYLDTISNQLGGTRSTISDFDDYLDNIVATSGFEDEVNDCLSAGFSGVQSLQAGLNALSATMSGVVDDIAAL